MHQQQAVIDRAQADQAEQEINELKTQLASVVQLAQNYAQTIGAMSTDLSTLRQVVDQLVSNRGQAAVVPAASHVNATSRVSATGRAPTAGPAKASPQSRKAAKPSSGQKTSSAPPPLTVSDAPNTAPPQSDWRSTAYVLQLGAFADLAKANAAWAELPRHLGAEIVQVNKTMDQGTYYVVLASGGATREATEQMMQREPLLAKGWIRALDSVLQQNPRSAGN